MRYFNLTTTSVNADKTKLLTTNEVLHPKSIKRIQKDGKLMFQRITSSVKHQNLQNVDLHKTRNQ